MLNIGVIGMGIGERHALAYQSHPGCNLKSICDFDKEKSRQLSIKYPKVNVYEDAEDILMDEDIDLISIASYDNHHFSQIIKAFDNGKHVMAEKPLCLNQDQMFEIYHKQKQNPDNKLSSNLVLRTNARFKKFKEDFNSNKFGDVFYLEGDYFWGRKQKLYGWRSKMDYYSIIYGAAIHMIDLVMWLMEEKPVSVQAVGNDIANKNSPLKFNSFAALFLKFENGIIAKITGNGGCVHPHFHGLKIYGTKKTAIHNLTNAYYLDSSELDFNPILVKEPYPEKEERGKIIHSFLDSILDERKKPIVSNQNVYDLMSVCFSAEEAMNTGKNIKIKYLG